LEVQADAFVESRAQRRKEHEVSRVLDLLDSLKERSRQ
jgi:hypothetical protein